MKRKQPEFLLQCVIADYLRMQYPNLLAFAVPNGEKRTPATGARLKRMGVRAGVADLLVFWNDGYTGHLRAAALELKAAKGRLEESQEKFLCDWVGAGGKYAVIRSLDDLIAVFADWGVPKITKCPTAYANGALVAQYVKPRQKGGVE